MKIHERETAKQVVEGYCDDIIKSLDDEALAVLEFRVWVENLERGENKKFRRFMEEHQGDNMEPSV